MRSSFRVVLWAVFAALQTGLACASPAALRAQEIAECRAGEIATWNDGRDRPAQSDPLRFYYRHAGAPAWFSAEQVLGSLRLASAAWSGCGVGSRVQALGAQDELPAGAILVAWSEPASRGNFGLANLSQRSLGLSEAAFTLLRSRNPKHPAEEILQMVISHEMGHFFGLMAHSRRCVDVTSYYHDGKGGQCYARQPSLMKSFAEYRSTLPTACDIERCRIANGRLPKPQP